MNKKTADKMKGDLLKFGFSPEAIKKFFKEISKIIKESNIKGVSK